jgi:hypothetical protein
MSFYITFYNIIPSPFIRTRIQSHQLHLYPRCALHICPPPPPFAPPPPYSPYSTRSP